MITQARVRDERRDSFAGLSGRETYRFITSYRGLDTGSQRLHNLATSQRDSSPTPLLFVAPELRDHPPTTRCPTLDPNRCFLCSCTAPLLDNCKRAPMMPMPCLGS